MRADTTTPQYARAELALPGDLTDTEGNLVHAVVHPADIQYRDGAPLVLAGVVSLFPWLRHLFADGGDAGGKLRRALGYIGKWAVQTVKLSYTAKGFDKTIASVQLLARHIARS